MNTVIMAVNPWSTWSEVSIDNWTSTNGSMTANITLDVVYVLTSITNADGDIIIGQLNTAGEGKLISIIGAEAFLVSPNLTSIILDDNITSIGTSAFSGCTALTSITLSVNIASIKFETFLGCSSLTSINLTSVTNIEENAFKDCINLTSVQLGSGLTDIGVSAFSGCTALTSIVIPALVTTIGVDAFNVAEAVFLCPKPTFNLMGTTYYDPDQVGWTSSPSVISLAAVTPGALASISIAYVAAAGPTKYYPAFTLIPIWGEWQTIAPDLYTSTSTQGNLVANITKNGSNYELGQVQYGDEAFTFLAYIDIAAINAVSGIPSTHISAIQDNAFEGCTGLIGVNIPFGVTTIGSLAFSNCNNLTSVVLPTGLTTIGELSFSFCYLLPSINIPSSVTTIGDSAFVNCGALTTIALPTGLTSIGESAFASCALTSIVIPDGITIIYAATFTGCPNLASVVLPHGIVTIGENAFGFCPLTSIVLPANVTAIEFGAFQNCPLTSIILPAGLQTIGESAFQNCVSLTTIALPADLQTIGEAAFSTCGLTSIVIPASVASVGETTFDNCTAVGIFLCPYASVNNGVFGQLSSIFYDPAAPGWPGASAGTSLVDVSDNALIAYKAQYIAAGGDPLYYPKFGIAVPTWPTWSSVGSGIYTSTSGDLIATMTDISGTNYELTSIKKTNGDPFDALTYIDISGINAVSDLSGSKIVSIGTEAFQNCTGLAAINFTDETVTIGDSAFYGCTGLTSISLSLIQTIGPSAFNGCTGLTTIAIPLVTELASQTFNSCSALASIAAPAVTDFGQYVFSGCSSLVRFTLPAGLIDISDGLFVNCSSLKTVEIPSTVTTIGGNAFFECSGIISMNIPRSVTTIDPYAFFGCTGLTSISIPSSVTQIATELFNGCANLSSVLIPASITSVGPFAFAGCPNLSSVVLPTGAVCQGPNVFGTDPSSNPIVVFLGPYSDVSGSDAILTTVYFDPTQTGWPAPSSKYKSLADVSANTLILLKDQYLAAQGPSDYYPAFGIAIPAWGSWPPGNPTATSISTNGLLAHLSVTDDLYTLLDIRDFNGYPFTNSTYIDLLSLANAGGGTIVAIADSAFQGCTGLAAIAIPPSVTDISQNAFYGCTDLVSIVIPSSVPTAYTATFAGCAAATAVFLDPYFITTSVTPYDLLAGLDPSKIYFIPRPVVNPFATPFTDPIPFDPPVVPDWPGTSNSLGGAAPGSLTFMSEEYLVADGPAEYNGVFGLPIPCYVKGTLILTFRDYVPIEDLVEGDMIVSHGSIHAFRCRTGFRFRPIVWKGHFTAHGLDDGSRPICIKKDAFGRNKPFRDLYVSPGHRILVGGRMLTAHELLNGSTVVPHECDEVTYYHIELDRHAVIIANGIAAESYVDVDNRKMFRTSRR